SCCLWLIGLARVCARPMQRECSVVDVPGCGLYGLAILEAKMRAHQSALSAASRNAFKVSTTMPLLAVAFFSWLLSVPAASPAAESAVDFPLASNTKWIYTL